MRLRSQTFTGEFPTGVHWSPGEEREVPEARLADVKLPLGLVAVEADPPAPQPGDDASGEE